MAYRDFSCTDLDGLNLDGAILCGSLFEHTSLDETSMKWARMHGCIINTELYATDLSEAVLFGAFIHSSQFISVILENAVLSQTRMGEVLFRGVNARGSMWYNPYVKDTRFIASDLTHAVAGYLVHATMDDETAATLSR